MYANSIYVRQHISNQQQKFVVIKWFGYCVFIFEYSVSVSIASMVTIVKRLPLNFNEWRQWVWVYRFIECIIVLSLEFRSKNTSAEGLQFDERMTLPLQFHSIVSHEQKLIVLFYNLRRPCDSCNWHLNVKSNSTNL